jgi:16S rRNA C967 or C1407 C5-methylase (RsmB/RsmF family)
MSEKDALINVTSFPPESFDRILLDPPCSALGLRPKLQIDMSSMKDLQGYPIYQRMFVKEAVALLKPGGTLTYSTCTIHANENEGMVRHILDEYPCMKLQPIDFDIGLCGLPGFGLSDQERTYVRRFDPSDAADTMGFFVAKFSKHAQSKFTEKTN